MAQSLALGAQDITAHAVDALAPHHHLADFIVANCGDVGVCG